MSTHSELRKAETAVIELARELARSIDFDASEFTVFDTNKIIDLRFAILELNERQRDLDGDAAHNRTQTSVIASKLPGKGALRRRVLDVLLTRYAWRGEGMTTDAVERQLHRPHTSVSSAMNYLVNHGLVGDSGMRHNTSHGSPAIMYAPTELARELLKETLTV